LEDGDAVEFEHGGGDIEGAAFKGDFVGGEARGEENLKT
jgi:hypothetical protein